MVIIYLYAFWMFYLAVMSLYRAHLNKTLTRSGYVLGAPVILLGLLLDVIMNFSVFIILFAEIPKELLVTKRLQRHIKGTGKRQIIAKLICEQLLNFADPTGNHCD